MKIKAIKAEQFQGFSDLEVQGLQSGLNVIQMPSWESVDEIHECVISTLLPIDDELCRTSLELELGDQTFRLDGIDSLGQISATRHDSETQDITRLSEHLTQFPAIVFERLFTDQVDLENYAEQWENIGLLPRILASMSVDSDQEKIPRPDFEFEIREHSEQLERIIRAESESRSADGSARQQELSKLYRDKKETNDRKDELAERSTELAIQQKNLESALSVLELWQKRESLEDDSTILSQLEALEELKIEVSSIDRQIQRIRNRIEKHKQQAEKKKKPKTSRFDKLLVDEDKAFQMEEQIEDLRYRIRSTDSPPRATTEVSKRSSRELLERLRPFAIAIQDARANLDLQKQSQSVEQNESDGKPEATSFLSGIAVTDLQKRVDILNSECARLRQPFELSSNLSFGLFSFAAFGIFLVFVGMLFPGKPPSPWLVGGGVAAILSCLVLWTSLRRPSTEQIRYYRLEIKRLVDEIQRIQDRYGEKFSVLCQTPITGVANAHHELLAAKTAWQDALRFEGIPAHLTPRVLLKRLKRSRSFASPSFEEHSFDSELDDLRFELTSKVEWLANWKVRLIEFTDSDSCTVDDSVAYLLRLARQFRKREEVDSENSNSVERLTKFQKQLKSLKEKRGAQLGQCGCETLKDLKQQMIVLQESIETDHRKENLTKEINRFLAGCENADQIRDTVKNCDEDALRHQSAQLEKQLVEIQAEIAKLARNDRELDKQISQLVNDLTDAYLELDRRGRNEQRKIHRQKLLCYLALANCNPGVRKEASLGLQYATQFFRQTTGWLDADITYCKSENDFLVSKTANQQKVFSSLSQSVQKQAGICIQLATAKVLSQQEGHMPFVLMGEWVTPGGRFTDATAQLMIELSEQDMQFIIIVGDDHSAQLFRELEQPVLVVDLKQETIVYEVDNHSSARAFTETEQDYSSDRGLVDLNSF